MKKLLLVCVTVASLLFSNNAQSQVKIGHFDEQSLLSLFPGLEQTMDSVMNIQTFEVSKTSKIIPKE